MRAMSCVRLLVIAVLLASGCGGLRSSPGPTPTPTQAELIDQAIASGRRQRQAYESKLAQLGQEIAAGQDQMSPEVLSTRLRTYATYQQAIARYDEIETQLDLVKVTLEAQVALGDLASTDEALKDASVLIQQYLHVDPLPTLAPGSVDEDSLLKEISLSVPTSAPTVPATPVPTAGPLQVHPYCDISASDVSLQDLVDGYGGARSPGRRTWHVAVEDPHDTVLVGWTWCAHDAWQCDDELSDNLRLIQIILTVDGQQVDSGSLCVESYTRDYIPIVRPYTTCCQRYIGRIAQWTREHHTIVLTRRFTADVNNGHSVFLAGDYVDIFEITVKK